MFFIYVANIVARMEADNDELFVSAPTDDDLDRLAKPCIDAWQITILKLSHGKALERTAKTEHGPPMSF